MGNTLLQSPMSWTRSCNQWISRIYILEKYIWTDSEYPPHACITWISHHGSLRLLYHRHGRRRWGEAQEREKYHHLCAHRISARTSSEAPHPRYLWKTISWLWRKYFQSWYLWDRGEKYRWCCRNIRKADSIFKWISHAPRRHPRHLCRLSRPHIVRGRGEAKKSKKHDPLCISLTPSDRRESRTLPIFYPWVNTIVFDHLFFRWFFCVFMPFPI